MGKKKKKHDVQEAAAKKNQPSNLDLAWEKLRRSALGGLLGNVDVRREERYAMKKTDWAYVTSDGNIVLNPHRDCSVREWEYIMAHCLLHLGFGHIREDRKDDCLWHAACDLVVARFLAANRIGTPPPGADRPVPVPAKSEDATYDQLATMSDCSECLGFGMMDGRPDMVWNGPRKETWRTHGTPPPYTEVFARSLQTALEESLREASEGPDAAWKPARPRPVWQEAREWFLSSYPLLGAVASAFRLVDDAQTAERMGVAIAAVSSEQQEIYINSRQRLSLEEWKFVLAHEFLHAALRHDLRCEERDPVLWNVACDFVINSWLIEMNVGLMPEGSLYDQQFDGLSAEDVYERLWVDVKRYTGQGAPKDIIYGGFDNKGQLTPEELDALYRSAIARGLSYHESQGRGYIPAGLVEEIHALSRPPIRWDVELAKWFDERFQPAERRRTYARASRRQAATPDIPRPAWHRPEELAAQQVYAVVLDTSGSMDRHMLAAALGSIASYSVSRDVDSVRVLFCDAAVYDQGMMRPDDIAGAVEVRGRGGTRLQPAIDLLDKDRTFPRHAPLLIITDGKCDRLTISGRDHAYLTPRGCRLPFLPKGPVFRMDA